MTATAFTRSLLVGSLSAALAACAPTILRIDTDPQGADVESSSLGYLGTTPIEKTFSDADIDKVGVGGNVYVNLKITKRDYVSIDLRQVSFEESTTFHVKKTLEQRIEQIEVTSEPEGVTVFQLQLDKDSPPQVVSLFDKDPMKAIADFPRWVTQRFIGMTTTSIRYDSENALEHNDPLLFQKAGYHPAIVYFKATQPRLHQVMRPINVKDR
jgi:hypothetical protein